MAEKPEIDAAACIREAKKGNLNALDPLLGSMRAELLEFVRHAFRNRPRGIGDSDLTQQTLLTALQHFDNFRGETEEALFAWLSKIALNLGLGAVRIMVTRKRTYRPASPSEQKAIQDYPDRKTPDPGKDALNREEVRLISRAIGFLPKEEEDLIRMHMRGKPIATIADKRGISPAAVYKRLMRAEHQLLAIFSENGF